MPKNLDQQKVADWVNEHWKDEKTCTICKGTDWTIGPDIVFVKSPTLESYPLVLLVCNQCGHTIFFNALIMGLVESDGK